jgi:hypothetical protein
MTRIMLFAAAAAVAVATEVRITVITQAFVLAQHQY